MNLLETMRPMSPLLILHQLLLLLLSAALTSASSNGISGYLLYCPCMGRFGNQAEQFLGSLAFAKSLRRTLVVPPWIVYGPPVSPSAAGVQLIPFARHFNLTHLAAGHPTIAMEDFMAKLAPAVWPSGSRTVFCHSPRDDGTCQAKWGSPFGPFWTGFGVEFDREEFFGDKVGPGLYSDSEAWRLRYPSNRYPVLALMGAPASFPARPSDLPLHRHLAFNAEFLGEIRMAMERWNMQRPILAVHLRNNVDFTGACASHVTSLPRGHGFFSSYQCFGPGSNLGHLSIRTCNPDDATISADVARVAASIGAKTIFVATDYDGRAELMRAAAPASVVTVLSSLQTGTSVFEDSALMTLADAALLNCVSSLSAFVRRSRDAAGAPTHYLGRDGAPGWRHDEL